MKSPANQCCAGISPAVSVIIPAFNEADRIGATVIAARALPGVAEVVVVDDGSTDATAEAACAAGATTVVRLNGNFGKARALEAGYFRTRGTLLLFLDADLGATASHAASLIGPVAAGETDMTVATFPINPGRGGGMGIVVRAARAGIARATGRTLAAPLSGQRCLTLAALTAARPLAPGFGIEVALTIDVLRAGFRVLEVPTLMDHRVTGRDWRARRHRLRQLRDVLFALLPRLLDPKYRRQQANRRGVN